MRREADAVSAYKATRLVDERFEHVRNGVSPHGPTLHCTFGRRRSRRTDTYNARLTSVGHFSFEYLTNKLDKKYYNKVKKKKKTTIYITQKIHTKFSFVSNVF